MLLEVAGLSRRSSLGIGRYRLYEHPISALNRLTCHPKSRPDVCPAEASSSAALNEVVNQLVAEIAELLSGRRRFGDSIERIVRRSLDRPDQLF
jgi:hypothetical protein